MQERDGWVDCAYLDLKKALDKVPCTRHLCKLKYERGLDGALLTWMEDVLRGRKMRTGMRDCVSDWRDVSSGVPQGSVLAPIMFLIYVNDLVDGIGSYASLFADDVKIMKRME